MRNILAALLFLWTGLAPSLALYSSKDAVVELTPKNFKQSVLESKHLVAVEFYAPWCGHCQRLAPAWKKAADNLKGLVTLGAVNCDEESNRPLCGQYEIKGFPTIKIFKPGQKKPIDYPGQRDARSIVDFMLFQQPSNVRFIKGDSGSAKSKKSMTLDEFYAVKNETLPKVLLFSNKATTSALYKALSTEFGDDRMLVGEVKKAEKDIVKAFGIKSYPTLVVLSPTEGIVQYTGKMKREPLYEFIGQYALPKSQTTQKPATGEEAAKKEKKKKESKANVQEIQTTKDFEEQCLKSGKICAVAIVTDDDRQETVSMLKEFNESSDLFRFSWLKDSKASSIVEKLDIVADYPTMFILHPSKHLYRPYVGAWDAIAIKQWLDQIARGRVQAWPFEGDLQVQESVEQPHDEL